MHNLSRLFELSPVTYCLMALIFVFSLTGFLNKKLFFQFILHPASIVRDNQFYRIITADLTNADPMHLLLNEFMLYVFCTHLEETLRNGSIYGSLQFVIIYVTSLLMGSVVLIFRYYHNFDYSTTGTSGSIMGCMFAFMVIAPNFIVYNFSEHSGLKNSYAALAYIIMLIIYQKRKKEELVNHEFHFYGAIGGILATLILFPSIL